MDLTARLGGEEFIILLILDIEETVPNIADRIREAIEEDVLKNQIYCQHWNRVPPSK